MNKLTLLLWLMTVTADSVGQLAFKAAASESVNYHGLNQWRFMLVRPWIWAGMICYVAQFLLWLAFLTLVELSVGMLLASTSIIVIMLAGRVWFKETLTRWRVIGILLIGLGVAVTGIHQ